MLEQNTRVYNPNNFDINLVNEYLSEFVWHRAIKKNGEVGFNGYRIYIGKSLPTYRLLFPLTPLIKNGFLEKLMELYSKLLQKVSIPKKKLKNFQ